MYSTLQVEDAEHIVGLGDGNRECGKIDLLENTTAAHVMCPVRSGRKSGRKVSQATAQWRSLRRDVWRSPPLGSHERREHRKSGASTLIRH
ncbi:unnamed protein product [Peronospora farinosa]|uniref:Uncharacterized protein n=1 Tax=Peronospora farinosa TaxID=134698 RepID=A0ABN8BY15_9STRA|nr:unnamed protein product [Peronospora farinosa]